ncbi:MAG: hypothetical protein QNJ98_14275 [Planctomycetota bacterium]|nr:hypothetical protein [Planctomycetota bacterium]
MWPYARATLKEAVTSPVTWGICLMGVFFGWFAATLAILALVDVAEESRELIGSTSQLFGALLAIGLLGRTLDEDSDSGFTLATDACAPGPGGRILGRWLGATIAGTAASVLIAAVVTASGAAQADSSLYLLYTSILSISLVAAWATLLASRWNGAAAGLLTILLWLLGHLPWGREPFLGGSFTWAGESLRAWLPGPRALEGWLGGLGYTSAAVAGLLLLALAFVRPAEPRA